MNGGEYRKAIKNLAENYSNSPSEFQMEIDMQYRVCDRIRKEMCDISNDSDEIPNPTSDISKSNEFDLEINPPSKYKKSYVNKDILELPRIIPELKYTRNINDTEEERRLDIGVLKENVEFGKVRHVSGGIHFGNNVSQIEGAIELKYKESDSVITLGEDLKDNIKNEDECEIRKKICQTGKLDTMINCDDIKKDLEDLDYLNERSSDGEYYTALVIFSPYNYLMQKELQSNSKYESKKKGYVVDEWFKNESDKKDVDIVYSHPGGAKIWRSNGSQKQFALEKQIADTESCN